MSCAAVLELFRRYLLERGDDGVAGRADVIAAGPCVPAARDEGDVAFEECAHGLAVFAVHESIPDQSFHNSLTLVSTARHLFTPPLKGAPHTPFASKTRRPHPPTRCFLRPRRSYARPAWASSLDIRLSCYA